MYYGEVGEGFGQSWTDRDGDGDCWEQHPVATVYLVALVKDDNRDRDCDDAWHMYLVTFPGLLSCGAEVDVVNVGVVPDQLVNQM